MGTEVEKRVKASTPYDQKLMVRLSFAGSKEESKEKIEVSSYDLGENSVNALHDILGGDTPVLMASTSGTIKQPDPLDCFGAALYAFGSFVNHLWLIQTIADFKQFGFNSKNVRDDFQSLLTLELFYAAILLMFEGISFTLHNTTGTHYIPFQLTTKHHFMLWTPPGLVSALKDAWNECGKPGSGLGQKIRDAFAPPVILKPVPVSVEKQVQVDLNRSTVDTDALAKAGAVVIGGAILWKIAGAVLGACACGPACAAVGAAAAP